ncbi:hypothetical protein [Orlajensenia leifsoniae]|uniref:Uncharacterized protein n=1 Tax=Orlajensenia leifsoniae TaxID=2561933 RepID=A0A4Y9QWM8_9MICO|nr:hypothetical protein [Leifsonia flava]TFV96637.1 hypothetical protein E4M00_11150 [Leifsonia flava]
MIRADALRIIAEEGLTRSVWFDEPTRKTNAVVIVEHDSGFDVFDTGERAEEVDGSRIRHQTEDAALTDFIHRLRVWNELAQREPDLWR